MAASKNEAPALPPTLASGLAGLGAFVAGAGAMYWMIANWSSLGRTGRFVFLELLVAALLAGAVWRPAARLPLVILGMFATAALLWTFQLTYATGLASWHLLTLFCLLTLPLCLAVRHDAAWMPWLVAVGAAAYQATMQVGSSSPSREEVVTLSLVLAAASALFMACKPGVRRTSGAGRTSASMALVLAAGIVAFVALRGLFDLRQPAFWAGALLLAASTAVLSKPRFHNSFALAVHGLALSLLLAGLSFRLLDKSRMLHDQPEYFWGVWLFVCALLLAAVVRLVRRTRRRLAMALRP